MELRNHDKPQSGVGSAVKVRTGHNYEQFKVFHDQNEKENDNVNHSNGRWFSKGTVL
jgi:hypothetical protein